MKKLIHKTKQNKIICLYIFTFCVFGLIINSNLSIAQPNDPATDIELHFGGQVGSSYCIQKENVVDYFLLNITNITVYKHYIDYSDPLNVSDFRNFIDFHDLEGSIVPFILMMNSTHKFVLDGEEITQENLDALYQSIYQNIKPPIEGDPITKYWLSYLTGFLMGFSPCIILVTTFMSSVMVIKEEQDRILAECSQTSNLDSSSPLNPRQNTTNHDLNEMVTVEIQNNSFSEGNQLIKSNSEKSLSPIYIGFVLGVVFMYILLSITTYLLNVFSEQVSFSYISSIFFGNWIHFGITVILCLLGIWFIIDAFNKDSKLFQTPPKLKKYFSKLAKKGEFKYAFILGFLFSFIKIPCVGSGLIALTGGVADNFSTYIGSLILFILGGLTPLIGLMIIIAKGANIEKIDVLRVKYRPVIRLLSGSLIIVVSIWAFLS
jgi:cytochrome c biogenesis protein CcdA